MYIWNKEIQEINDLTVKFTDGTEQEYTKTQLTYLPTKEAKDASAFIELVALKLVDDFMTVIKNAESIQDVNSLSAKVIDVMEEHNASELELRYALKLAQMKCIEIFKVVQDSYDYNLNIAIGKAFGTFKEWEHHSTCTENIRMSDIHKFL